MKIENILTKIGLERFLLSMFIVITLTLVIECKILGASNVPINVEKNGYCKIVYGDNWRNIKETNDCITYKYGEQIKETFLDNEFREVCPKNKILSNKFYSYCFHKSGGIN